MKHLNIRTACMFLICCVGVAGASSGVPASSPRERIVVQNYYYALPGKSEEVYQWRLHASDVRAKLGLPKGRVLRRMAQTRTAQPTDYADLPDVIWECEYPSLAARSADVERLGKSLEFDQVEKHMDTLIRHFQRAIFELKD